MTATHEFVVPRSMPMTLPMKTLLSSNAARARVGVSARARPRFERWSADLDVYLPQPRLFGLRHVDLEHAVAVRRLHGVGADRGAQRERSLELPGAALDPEQGAILLLRLDAARAADREGVADQADLHVLLRDPGEVGAEHERLRRLLDVHNRNERRQLRTARGAGEDSVHEPTELVLHSDQVAGGHVAGTPTNECHRTPPAAWFG